MKHIRRTEYGSAGQMNILKRHLPFIFVRATVGAHLAIRSANTGLRPRCRTKRRWLSRLMTKGRSDWTARILLNTVWSAASKVTERSTIGRLSRLRDRSFCVRVG